MDHDGPLPAPVARRVPIAREDVDLGFEQPWNIKQDTLVGFQNIPRELQERIFSLACTLRPFSTWPGHDFSPQAVDSHTTRSVALVSRSCYKLATPLLYRRVKIKKPSALRELQHTLAVRPSLGRLIKSLHIGPVDSLPERWWPICSSSAASVRLTTALLGSSEYSDKRPGWCQPFHDFEVPYNAGNGEYEYEWHTKRMTAMSEAILAASRALDIDMKQVNKNGAGLSIDANVYTIRVFEVQAACELYLLELRRRHGRVTCCGSDALVYPCLAIVGLSSDVPNSDVFWITLSQLRAHIARRGALTDHFSHPLLFARCGMEWTAEDQHGQTHQGHDSNAHSGGVVSAVDVFSLTSFAIQASGQHAAVDLRDELSFSLPSTSTIGGNLALLRAVLAFTPETRSLSLTGFLERGVVGKRSAPTLRALESLTVGPPPPGWRLFLHVEHAMFTKLKRLRICGVELDKDEIDRIVGRKEALPQLQKFQWSLSERFPRVRPPLSLFDTINELLTFDKAAAVGPENARQGSKRQRKEFEEGSKRARPILVQACLHTKDANAILTAAPSSDLRAAWRNGRPVPGYNRFQVFVNRSQDVSGSVAGDEKKVLREMYDEGIEWLDAGAMASGNGGEVDEQDEDDEAEEEEG